MTSLTMNRRRGGSFLLLLNLSMLAKKPSNLGALLVVASSFLPALVSSSHRACRSGEHDRMKVCRSLCLRSWDP